MNEFIITGGICSKHYHCETCDDIISRDVWVENGGLCDDCYSKQYEDEEL